MASVAFMFFWLKFCLYGAAFISCFFVKKDAAYDNKVRQLLLSAVVVHVIFVIMYILSGGYTPAHMRYDASIVQSLILAVILLSSIKRHESRLTITLAVGTILFISVCGVYKSTLTLEPHMPAHHVCTFLFFHFKDAAIACFAYCFCLSVGHLIQPEFDGTAAGKNPGAIYTYALWGFVLFSASQAFGSVWAVFGGYGDVWIWRPMHFYSAMIWIFYATMLHVAASPSWPRKSLAAMGIIGYALVVWWWLYFDFVVKPAWHAVSIIIEKTGGLI